MKKTYSPAFKASVAIESTKEGMDITQLAIKFDISKTLIYEWRAILLENAWQLFENPEHRSLRIQNNQQMDVL